MPQKCSLPVSLNSNIFNHNKLFKQHQSLLGLSGEYAKKFVTSVFMQVSRTQFYITYTF